MLCLVCGAPEAEPHFGAMCCRACAAFFRRYFHSKKGIVSCTCSQRVSNSHPCRECRMMKCLAIGMNEGKIKMTREKHKNPRVKKPVEPVDMVPFQSEPGSSCRIIPRDSSHISSKSSKSWPSYDKKRMELHGGSWHLWNLYGLTSYVKKDGNVFWDLVTDLFPQVRELKNFDKDSLLANFASKWYQFEPAIDFSRNYGFWDDPTNTFEDSLVHYYTFEEGVAPCRREIIQTFGRYWKFYVENVIIPIASQGFDDKELLAIILLLFFDSGYTNITEKCVEMCRTIRKVIFQELNAYEKDISETRFFNIINVPLTIEKGQRKFEEEMLVCKMHHVRIHDDFLEVTRRHNL